MARLRGQVTVTAVGRLRTKHWLAAQQLYLKRLEGYTSIALIEVKDMTGRSVPDAVAMRREGVALLKTAEAAAYKVVLTPDGQQMTSPALAAWLQAGIERHGRLAFIIGGPLGLAGEVVAACDFQLSLSSLTFPHELARVMLLEQLYRAFTILHGEKYHK
jgi:23S rRNA (pseudouridine1915-N3)-methyltransferase